MKTNSFLMFGWLWIFFGILWAIKLRQAYGGEIPATVEEWLGEIMVGQIFIVGTVMISIGRYLRDKT